MIIEAKLALLSPKYPNRKPIGPAKAALTFSTNMGEGKVLILKTKATSNLKLKTCNEVSVCLACLLTF